MRHAVMQNASSLPSYRTWECSTMRALQQMMFPEVVCHPMPHVCTYFIILHWFLRHASVLHRDFCGGSFVVSMPAWARFSASWMYARSHAYECRGGCGVFAVAWCALLDELNIVETGKCSSTHDYCCCKFNGLPGVWVGLGECACGCLPRSLPR